MEAYSAEHRESLQSTKTRTSSKMCSCAWERMPTNNSLWASKAGNSGHMESVTCDRDRSGVFGQPVPRASAPRSRNFSEPDLSRSDDPIMHIDAARAEKPTIRVRSIE